jgi:hypothetical protein
MGFLFPPSQVCRDFNLSFRKMSAAARARTTAPAKVDYLLAVTILGSRDSRSICV